VRLIPPGLLPDDEQPPSLSFRALKGQIAERVVWEVNRLKKELARQHEVEPLTFESLRSRYPKFKVLEILAKPPFDDEDRDLICHPARWGRRATGHAYIILKRFFSPKNPQREPEDETLRAYRKAFRKAFYPRKTSV
jgi:hypothetical protein